MKAASDFERARASLSYERTFAPACAVRVRNFVVMPALGRICAQRCESDARINVILARTVVVKVPTGLVQHLAEGHDVKRAEGGGLGNTTAAVIHAVTTAAGKVKCRRANVSQGVAH